MKLMKAEVHEESYIVKLGPAHQVPALRGSYECWLELIQRGWLYKYIKFILYYFVEIIF